MERRRFLKQVAGVAAAAALPGGFTSCASSAARAERPNLVFIMSDDLGYVDLSSTGRSDYSTPALDGLAREGVRLTQAYSAAPVSTPTRVALMTGQYPARN